MKKLSIALAALLVLSMLAACKKTENDPVGSDESTSAPASSSSVDTTEPKDTEASTQTTEENKDTQPPDTTEEKPAPVQNTEVPAQTDYDIPKASKAPTIDGKFDADEWKGALEITIDNTNTTEKTGSGAVCQGGTFRYLWDDSGLYVSMEINDSVISDAKHIAGNGSYNSLDGTQMAIYVDPNCTGGDVGKLFFFSLCPEASDGNPYIGEHFIYGNGSAGSDVPDAAIASTITANGYIIECRIDSAAFAKGNIEIKKGTTLILANIILDNDNVNQGLFVDTAWFDAANTNNYTLVD